MKRVPNVGDEVRVNGEAGVIHRRFFNLWYAILYEGTSLGFAQTEEVQFGDTPDSPPMAYDEQVKDALTRLADALESMKELDEAERATWVTQLRILVGEIGGP